MRSSAFGLFFLVIASKSYSGSSGNNFRNGFKDSGPELDSRELERQNRITQQILQRYLERRLHLNRSSGRAPSVWEILPTSRPPDNNIQDLLQQKKGLDTEGLQSVESEQISSVYEDEENELDGLLGME